MKLLLCALTCLVCFSLSAQIEPFFQNNFEDGTTQGWANGTQSPNPPTNIPSGGPGGVDDNFLEKVSAGGTGAGSRMIIFNEDSEWTGNYGETGAVIEVILFQAKNPSNEDLLVRVAMRGGSDDTTICTTAAVIVPPQFSWNSYTLDLEADSFTIIDGTSTIEEVLASVNQIRILHSATPSWIGDVIAATLHLDNLEVFPPLLSIEETNEESVVMVPNPAENYIDLISAVEIESYQLWTLEGRLLKTSTLVDSRVDISILPSGIYLLEVQTEGGSTIKRIIKQ